MPAKGKVNASNVQTGDRILVHVYDQPGENDCFPSGNKTGERVETARVTSKLKARARGYVIYTTSGRFYAEPIQTMWLAPEDPAGIRRAHVEALKLNV